jgi:transposase InsO family protein
VAWAITEKGYSQRRDCGLVGMEPKTYRHASKRPDDGALRERLKDLARERRQFGYRRLLILLRRDGIELNHKKLFRLCKEERLTVRRRGGRKRALGTRAPMTLPQGPNSVGASTSSPTCSPTGDASGFWWSSTTSRESAWLRWSTPRCPVAGSPASSTASSKPEASR